MVVLRPALEGERAKSCSCGHLGICSPVRERSSFYPRRREGGYRSECRRCSTRKTIESQRRRGEAYRESHRAAEARWRERNRERKNARDRERARREWRERPERVRQRQRRYKAKLRRDPERHAAALERDRMNYRGRREREGKVVATATKQSTRTGQALPIGPFRAWVDRLVAEQEREARFFDEPYAEQIARTRAAGLLGVSVRTLYRYRFELDEVWEGMVDAACSHHGGVHILDLYPNLYDEAEAA